MIPWAMGHLEVILFTFVHKRPHKIKTCWLNQLKSVLLVFKFCVELTHKNIFYTCSMPLWFLECMLSTAVSRSPRVNFIGIGYLRPLPFTCYSFPSLWDTTNCSFYFHKINREDSVCVFFFDTSKKFAQNHIRVLCYTLKFPKDVFLESLKFPSLVGNYQNWSKAFVNKYNNWNFFLWSYR